MNEIRALRGLRWSYCAFIAWSSAQTFLAGRATHDLHALLLSSVELVAIAAFLFAPLEVIACAVLLAIYALASAITIAEGDVPLRFVYFAMTAVYIAMASSGFRSSPAQSRR